MILRRSTFFLPSALAAFLSLAAPPALANQSAPPVAPRTDVHFAVVAPPVSKVQPAKGFFAGPRRAVAALKASIVREDTRLPRHLDRSIAWAGHTVDHAAKDFERVEADGKNEGKKFVVEADSLVVEETPYPKAAKYDAVNAALKERLDPQIEKLPSTAKKIVSDALAGGAGYVDLFFGSQFRTNDATQVAGGVGPGRLYEKWKTLPGITPRISSHPHDGQQYEVAVGPYGVLLFGTYGKSGGTWFQMEAHSAKKHPIAHILNFFEYKVTHDQQGPLGISPHTQDHAVRLDLTTPKVSSLFETTVTTPPHS